MLHHLRIRERLWAPCDIAGVAYFRAAFAFIILCHIYLYFSNGLIAYYFGAPEHHLSYPGFEWVQPLELEGMRRVHYLMALAAIGVFLGLLYRIAALVLFVTFTYTFLSEAAQFQNHYYLMSLISFLLIFIPAHRSFSIDSILFQDKAAQVIPGWCRWLLIFQLSVPYVFGGIAKLDGDWLHGFPVGMWIAEKKHLPFIGPWLTEHSAACFISYTGLVLDLIIVPLLLYKPTRLPAFLVITVFHVSNSFLFSIDVFPWMMILSTPLFFSPGWPRRFLRLSHPSKDHLYRDDHRKDSRAQWLITCFLGAYVCWQLTFPFRHLLYPGNPSWTEEGQQFAWRMMLRRKEVFFRVYATDGPSQTTMDVPVQLMMSSRQIMELAVSPAQIAACAPFFAVQAEKIGMRNVEIRAVVLTSLNGRKPQLQIDPKLNLLTIKPTIWPQRWITPLTEPRRETAWDMPSDEWPGALGVQLPSVQQRLPESP